MKALEEQEKTLEGRVTAGDQRIEAQLKSLDDRLTILLAAKDERISVATGHVDALYEAFTVFGAVSGFGLLILAIRDFSLRARERQRQEGIESIVKDIMGIQKIAAQQQVEVGGIRVKQEGESAGQQLQAIQKVNEVIDVVKKTLEFRQQQEEQVAKTLGEVEKLRGERDKVRQSRLAQAVAINENFVKMSRMQFSALNEEQRKRGQRLMGIVDNLQLEPAVDGIDVCAALLLTCGIVAYYENDVVEAKHFLDHASECRTSDHNGTLEANEKYRERFAVIHYFRALIQKNWGDLSSALFEIEQSAKLLEKKATEFLSPVTRVELLLNVPGDEEHCRRDLYELLRRMDELEADAVRRGESLNSNQRRLRLRMLVYVGNSFFVQGKFAEAVEPYARAFALSPGDYYALSSLGQCYKELRDVRAKETFRDGLSAIEHGGDFRRKRELTTRAVIAAIATLCATECGDGPAAEQWVREGGDLLAGDLIIDGLKPRYFSPRTKRLVSSAELLGELRGYGSV